MAPLDGTPWSSALADRPFLRGNLHTHTTGSDGRLSPQETVDWFSANGYDLLALTDHNRITDPATLDARGITLLTASEVSATGGELGATFHLVTLGLSPATVLPPVTTSARESIRALTETGAVVFVAHPHWSGLTVGDLAAARDAGASGIEIYNGGTVLDSQKGEALTHWDELLERGAKDGGPPSWGIAVDDTHWHTIDRALGWVMVRAADRSPGAIIDALRTGAFYASSGPEMKDVRVSSDAEGLHVEVDTSPVAAIYALGYGSRNQFEFDREAAARGASGATISSARFTLKPQPPGAYLRLQATDWHRRSAWTNPLYLS